jgi:hypothetical protein
MEKISRNALEILKKEWDEGIVGHTATRFSSCQLAPAILEQISSQGFLDSTKPGDDRENNTVNERTRSSLAPCAGISNVCFIAK